jgi:hypothetical protein
VDAHADINTPARSNSGNMHGMPVAFLMGLVENANKLPGFQWFKPCMKPSDLVYIGLRDVDSDERRTIKNLGIKAFSVSIANNCFRKFFLTCSFPALTCSALVLPVMRVPRCMKWTNWASAR